MEYRTVPSVPRWLISATAAVIVLSGCGSQSTGAGPSSTTAGLGSVTVPPPGSIPGSVSAETWAPIGAASLVAHAQLIVTGSVARVEVSDDPVVPYDTVTLTVDRVIKSTPDAQTAVGDTVSYLARQTGAGDEASGLPDGVVVADRYGPKVTTGDRLLAMFVYTEIQVDRDRFVKGFIPTFGYQAMWILAGGTATSADPLRTAPENEVIDAIVTEVADPPADDAERTARDAGTVRDVRGILEPPPPTTATTAPPTPRPQIGPGPDWTLVSTSPARLWVSPKDVYPLSVWDDTNGRGAAMVDKSIDRECSGIGTLWGGAIDVTGCTTLPGATAVRIRSGGKDTTIPLVPVWDGAVSIVVYTGDAAAGSDPELAVIDTGGKVLADKSLTRAFPPSGG